MDILSNGYQVKNYFIHSLIKKSKRTLLYQVEDFITGKTLLLYQFESSQKEIYTALEKIVHTNINRVFKVFEFEGNFFAVSKLIEGTSLQKYLFSSGELSEKEINQYISDLLSIMITLKKNALGITVLDTEALILYKKGELCLNELHLVCEYSSDSELMEVLGRFLYFIVTKEIYKEEKEICKSNKYSKSLLTFIEQLLKNKENKTFASLEKIASIMSVKNNKEESCEPLVCQEEKKKSSSFLALLSVVLISAFSLYILFFSKEEVDIKNLNAIDALRYYVAAYLDNPKAKYALAEMYEYGSFVDKDITKAIEWYEKAAKSGDTAAKSYLAYLYLNDKKSVPKDIQKSLYWYKEAAKDRDVEALYALGYIYARDKAVKDIDKAIYWYEKAAKRAYTKAYYALGLLYFNRNRDKQDYKKAMQYFLKEKESNSYSQMALAYMYAKGLGTSKDTHKAIVYYEKSAKEGHAIAQLNLANIYAYNKDEAIRDKTLAKYWYEQAAKQGNKVAKKELQRLDKIFQRYDKQKIKAKKKVFQAVRYGHLIDRGTYIEDTQNGLLWQKDGRASGRVNFYQAQEYARSLRLGGMKGWRVPTAEELDTIFPATQKPFINTMYTNKPCCTKEHYASHYWTSQLDTRQSDYAYIYQWYGDGGVNNGYASKNYVYVRCVHD